MPKQTEVNRRKAQARELLRQKPGLTSTEIANLTGLSKTSARRVLTDVRQGVLPGAKAQTSTTAPASDAPKPEVEEPKTTLEFEESPAPPEKKSPLDEAMKSLKGMIGLGDKQESKAAPVLAAKLDPRRQAFVDSVSPILALGAMSAAAWMWGRIGPEYSGLAPDDKVAQRIMEPLVRIYARHAQFLTEINPDVVDVGASMAALAGYVHISLKLYEQIKLEKEELDYEQEQGYQVGRSAAGRHWRRQRATPESDAGHGSSGYADVSGVDRANGSVNGANGGHSGGVDLTGLSDKEARQHAALSRLAELDYLHRARRSGRP